MPNTEVTLYVAFQNGEAKVRYRTAVRLGWRFKEASNAAPHLLPLLRGDVLDVRRAALHAIATIGSDRYGTIANEVLTCIYSEATQMRLDVGNVLRKAAREDPANERLIRVLLSAYSNGDRKMRETTLIYFDFASFSRVEPILDRLSRDVEHAESGAAREVLTIKRRTERQARARDISFRPNFVYELVTPIAERPAYMVGALLAQQKKLARNLLGEVWKWLK